MRSLRGTLRLFTAVVALYVALLGWWLVFFARQGDLLVSRAEAAGAPLTELQARAVRDATRTSGRMFLFEGSFVGLSFLAGMLIVLHALRREAELRQRQRDFLSFVTHELRSPIAAAKLYLETLMLGRAEGEKAARYLANAHEDLGRLEGMVEQLLSTARVARQGVEVHPERVDLAAVVADVQGELMTEHAMRGARVEFELAEPVPVVADPSAVETILRNLVSNAVKYGGDPPRVAVRATREGARGVLEVRDFGPGLRGADARRIFEAFERGRADDVRARPGVGLGLYLVAELVRAQGGRVAARDGLPGGGTLVRVSLPAARK